MEYIEPQQNQWVQHIRMRPGMYIGSLNTNGFKQLLEYLFVELLEYKLTAPVFEITFYPANRLTIRVTQIDTHRFSLEIPELDNREKPRHHLGLWTVISLSSELSITVHDLPTVISLSSEKGDYQVMTSTSQAKENEVSFDFSLDKDIFKELKFAYDEVNPFLKQFAYLNPDLKIISKDHSETEYQRSVFYYPKGIFHQLDFYLSQNSYWRPINFRLDIEASLNEYHYRIAVHDPCGSPYTKTFAGNTETCYGGSLEAGIIQGLTRSIKALAKREQVKVQVTKNYIKGAFSFIAAVSGKDFVYEGCTKQKLGVPLIKEDAGQIVYEHMMDYYASHPIEAMDLLRSFRSFEEDEALDK